MAMYTKYLHSLIALLMFTAATAYGQTKVIKRQQHNSSAKSTSKNDRSQAIVKNWWEERGSFNEGLAYVIRKSDDKYGFIDKNGKVIIPCKWRTAFSFSEGLAPVEDDRGKWGYIDKTGKIVIPFQWEWANSFSEGLACVKGENGKYGYIDKTGNLVIPCKWVRETFDHFRDGLVLVQDEKYKYHYLDIKGNVVIKFDKYICDAHQFSENMAGLSFKYKRTTRHSRFL